MRLNGNVLVGVLGFVVIVVAGGWDHGPQTTMTQRLVHFIGWAVPDATDAIPVVGTALDLKALTEAPPDTDGAARLGHWCRSVAEAAAVETTARAKKNESPLARRLNGTPGVMPQQFIRCFLRRTTNGASLPELGGKLGLSTLEETIAPDVRFAPILSFWGKAAVAEMLSFASRSDGDETFWPSWRSFGMHLERMGARAQAAMVLGALPGDARAERVLDVLAGRRPW
ncbi:hypothetical protein [Sorangium sp. So ce1153]|uniref:hypothetical protein n=1 Tax=Sorangium sp. So ce1153 TaxID=3133333 RepID=UPI003F5DBB78